MLRANYSREKKKLSSVICRFSTGFLRRNQWRPLRDSWGRRWESCLPRPHTVIDSPVCTHNCRLLCVGGWSGLLPSLVGVLLGFTLLFTGKSCPKSYHQARLLCPYILLSDRAVEITHRFTLNCSCYFTTFCLGGNPTLFLYIDNILQCCVFKCFMCCHLLPFLL